MTINTVADLTYEFAGRQALQPNWPIGYDFSEGPYKNICSTPESIQQNLVFLLKTIPGSWPMNPDIGVGLETYLFETYGSPKLDEFRPILESQVKKYLPCIKILRARFSASDQQKDESVANLTIIYHIPSLGEHASVRCSSSISGQVLVEPDVLEI